MTPQYRTEGNKIVLFDKYEQSDVAFCDEPDKAIKLFDQAHYLNDVKRQYTASARLFARAEELPGFKWIEVTP